MVNARTVQMIQPTIGIEANKIIKVAAYCRVSSDSEDQANSFISQVKYYTDFISSNDNMKLVDIYADEGITGTCMSKRDDFQRMMQDCKLGKINRILVKSVSRFARNSLECLEAIRKLKDYSVSVLFENDNIDTTTMNSEMILYVKSAFAQSEALSCSRRMASACRMKMENGTYITASVPYGYNFEDKKLVINTEEAEVVKRIFNMYVSGTGKDKIAGILNMEGAIGKERWSNYTINYILHNEKYIGDTLFQKTYTPTVIPFEKLKNNGELDKYYVKGTHEAIIDKDLFDTVQGMLEKKSHTVKRELKKEILSGKIICNTCGWKYYLVKQKGKRYWVCSNKSRAGFNCDGPNILENNIFDAFVQVYNKLQYFKEEILNKTIVQIESIRDKLIKKNKEISEIDVEIARLCEQNNRYVRFKERKIMDDVSFIEQTNRLKLKLTELRNKRKVMLGENEFEKRVSELEDLKEILSSSPEAILEFDKNLFNDIVDQILVKGDGTLIFVLIGNLKLKEKVEVFKKCQKE